MKGKSGNYISGGLSYYLSQMKYHKVLSKEKEAELARAYQNGDKKAGDKIIKANLKFVIYKAKQYKGYINGTTITLDDLIQAGNYGMLLALKKFDPSYDRKFCTFAGYYISTYINNMVMKNIRGVKTFTSVSARKLFYKMGEVKEILEIQDPDRAEEARDKLANKCGVSRKDLADFENRMHGSCRSMDQSSIGEDGVSYHETVPCIEKGYDKIVSDDTIRFINKTIKRMGFSDREHGIINQRILSDNPKSLQHLANEYGISRERVRQIQNVAIRKIQSSRGKEILSELR